MNGQTTLFQRLRAWAGDLANSPQAPRWLFLTAFVEASLFPIPPDIPLTALSIAQPKQTFRFAAICAAGSVAGSVLGYFIGTVLFEAVGSQIVAGLGVADEFRMVLDRYRDNAWLALLLAGFTPVPYMVFTIAAGVNGTIGLPTLLLGSIVGRGVRFLFAGGVLFLLAPVVQRGLDRYLRTVMLALGALLLTAILVLAWVR